MTVTLIVDWFGLDIPCVSLLFEGGCPKCCRVKGVCVARCRGLCQMDFMWREAVVVWGVSVLTWKQICAWFTSANHAFDGGREPRPVVGQPRIRFSFLKTGMRCVKQEMFSCLCPAGMYMRQPSKAMRLYATETECQMVFNCLAGCSGGRLIRSIHHTTQSRTSWYAMSVTAACRRSSRR